MKKIVVGILALSMFVSESKATQAENFSDTTRSYSLPIFTPLANGKAGLSWTEVDKDGVNYFYYATTDQQGKDITSKKVIYASKGLRSSRLMRSKVHAKKDGTLVAVFGFSPQAAAPAVSEAHPAGDHAGHSHGAPATPPTPPTPPKGPATASTNGKPGEGKPAPRKGRGPSDLQIVFAESKDGGNTWSEPKRIHEDITLGVLRGFYDSVLMPNDELAVAYLKDTGKPHERHLHIITTKNGVPQEERLLDSKSCDCCPVNFLVDAQGQVNIYFRANNDNIRDMAKIVSKDNGQTFSAQQIISADNWEINGCPHSGPVSTVGGKDNVIAWFSAAPEKPGVRVATQSGQRLLVLDPSATNPYLLKSPKGAVMLYEEAATKNDQAISKVTYKAISATPSKVDVAKTIGEGTNPTGIVVNNQLWVAYEVKGSNDKTMVKLAQVKL